ncbi:aconitase [Desulfocapsa sulfexigens DSM 10523]|uniref:Aconitate hydratase n=1 Tax=Desulfocapsa sulfexigens (strain DSM 10523 / SB164P1) TaxID=1167006 RepID=M1PI56_DESSD|nr:aconitate hydratase AcnA [Desulfocapsa sulfexigens]AGF79280.1 aconitase [Desulfocapsa sulfexigens DSM 10523]
MTNPVFMEINTRKCFHANGKEYSFYSLPALQKVGFENIDRLPFSIRILLENQLRHLSKGMVTEENIINLASWRPETRELQSIPFMPGRVVLQDFTGVPAVVDLAALRSAFARQGRDPEKMNPFIPADLIIDHSIQVDRSGDKNALSYNVHQEFARNRERYTMLRWGQKAFSNFHVIPPGTGIVHQVNLEYLASVVRVQGKGREAMAYSDTVIGTDSHTTMINGLGVLGWGVGGIEAEAVLLGQPYSMQIPEVVGVKLIGRLKEGITATDLVLTITEFLRSKGVVGRFVEFVGSGAEQLSLSDRATIANMAPEYGATMGFFPVDQETLRYLSASGRSSRLVTLVERYNKEQGLFLSQTTPEPEYSVVYEIQLDRVGTSLAGPRKPQERIPLSAMSESFKALLTDRVTEDDGVKAGSCDHDAEGRFEKNGDQLPIKDGSVVIAAITSCTNTSNPAVMIGAGLLAQKAAEQGLQTKPWVKTSMAPGSMVVSHYLEKSGLLSPLEHFGFHVVGYGCTTCIGNSGPLDTKMSDVIKDKELLVAAVLSGNRNFEARIHPLVHANYLCSPQLVVAYAIAGTVMIDFDSQPLGRKPDGTPVYLRDIWPSNKEIETLVAEVVTPALFTAGYENVFSGNETWNDLKVKDSSLYQWDSDSSYIQEPPFFKNVSPEPPPLCNIEKARILAIFGDTITTDHISPAGTIPMDSPAGKYLQELGIAPHEFNSYGSRRGNHQVMMRGTFGNIRIKNRMVGREGGYTLLMPDRIEMSIYDAAMAYKELTTPLVIIGGKDYGTGSSRDWAAKGTLLLGVKAVIAKSFERIHRSNLVGMGVLPLQFVDGADCTTLDLDGSEELTIKGIATDLTPGAQITVTVDRGDNKGLTEFLTTVRLDNPVELEYYRHGGILQKVLRQMLAQK